LGQLSSGQRVGFIPPSDIDITIPASIKVIGLHVTAIMVPGIHGRDNFTQESQGRVGEVFLIPVGIDAQASAGMVLPVTPMVAVGSFATHGIVIGNEVNGARLNRQHQGRTVAHADGGPDAVLLANGPNRGGQLLLEFLTDVGHACSPVNECSITDLGRLTRPCRVCGYWLTDADGVLSWVHYECTVLLYALRGHSLLPIIR
jgi:hypothetical protein